MAEWILGSTILVDDLVGLLRQCECICCSLEIGIVYVRHDIFGAVTRIQVLFFCRRLLTEGLQKLDCLG